ncbi:MAG: hypothetical protein HUJ93_06670, partial [Bacteroidales bacterium]|nr:hypothetical protein [Bacteroidales bacterium]
MRRILLVLVFIPAFVLASCNHGEVIEDVRKMPPEISFDNTSGVYTVEVGDVLLIAPKYKYVEGASYLWEAEGKTISTAPSLSFRDTVARELYVLLTVKTDVGSAEDEIKIIVIDSSPIVPDPGTEPELDSTFSWYFPQDEFNVSQGREIRLTPYFIPLQGDGADYVWTRGENVLQSNSEAALIFKAEEIGQHNIAVTHLGHKKELVVNVCAAAGTYFREKTTASNRQFEKVLEYT